jgi:hypothetical protein
MISHYDDDSGVPPRFRDAVMISHYDDDSGNTDTVAGCRHDFEISIMVSSYR